MVCLFSWLASGLCAQAEAVHLARESVPEYFDVSLPLSAIAPSENVSTPRMTRRPGRFPPRPATGQQDPLLEVRSALASGIKRATPAMPSTLRSFEGLGRNFSGPQGRFSVNGDPPDTNGDIGPNHYVQIVNSSLAVFDRSGTVLYGPVQINTLWHNFGGSCETSTDGDPIVKYDKRADRWIVTQFSVTAPPYLECIAVSTTSDPTGSYYRYAYSFPYVNDYPKLGIWPDGYYFTFNMFDANDNLIGGEVCVFNRTAMLTGAAAAKQCFGPDANWYGMLPADLDGPVNPPAGSPSFVLSLDPYSTNSLNLWKLHTDWVTPTNSAFVGPSSIAVASYTGLCTSARDGSTCVPQQGTTTLLDGLGDRLMYRLAYRNMGTYEAIVANHSVARSGIGTGSGAVRWYEIRSPASTPILYQQGTFAPDFTSRWMGSVAMDGSGNIAIGYSVSSYFMYPSISFTGRLSTDPLSTLPQGETMLINSTGYHFDPTGLGRWGDYSSLSVDPTDDCTFWYTNEYSTSKAQDPYQWQTRIGSFKFPSCTCAYSLSAAGQTASATLTTGSVTVTAPSSCAWTALANANWIAVTSGSTSAGNGAISFSVAANTSVGGRSGTITVAAQTYTITQAGTGPSDCIFDWAEVTYPQFFSPAGAASAAAPPYYYRYYSSTANYLATSSADNHIWAIGRATENRLVDIGLVTDFSAMAGCSQ